MQEGVLSPLDFPAESNRQLEDFPFDTGGRGITAKAADFIDGLLAANVSTRFLKVDRERLAESWEAWVFVRIEQTPSREEATTHSGYFGPIYGFAEGRGVLTWQNSD